MKFLSHGTVERVRDRHSYMKFLCVEMMSLISDDCTDFSLREKVVILQGDLFMNYFLAIVLRRTFEFELGFQFSGEVLEKVKVRAISYQQLPSHIVYR